MFLALSLTLARVTNSTVGKVMFDSVSSNIVLSVLISIVKNKIVPCTPTIHEDSNSFKVSTFRSSSIAYDIGKRVHISASIFTASDCCDQAAGTVESTVR
jgi:hypothetical protein